MFSDFNTPYSASFFADSVSLVCPGPLAAPLFSALNRPGCGLWELIYADQGYPVISIADCHFLLSPGRFFIRTFSAPDLSCPARSDSPGLVCFTFSCCSPFLSLLSGQSLQSTKPERMLFAQLLLKASALARTSPYPHHTSCGHILTPSGSPYFFDAEINAFMAYILDRLLLRRFLPAAKAPGCMSYFPVRRSDHQYLSVLQYLKDHLSVQLSIDRICRDNLISRSRLEQLFHEKGWHGAIDCFSSLKIDTAKQLIADGSMTFTQISSALGYSSVQYFSRQFKEKTKMTPTEYSSFIKKHPGDVMPSLARYYPVCSRNAEMCL